MGNDKLVGLFLDELGEERETNEAEKEWLDCSLQSPVVTIESISPCNMQLNWDPVPGARVYEVWSRPGLGQAWTLEATTSNPFFPVGCIDADSMKLFRVIAVAN